MNTFPTGSISHGTLRPEDLIPTFSEAVVGLITHHREEIERDGQGVGRVQLETMVEIARNVEKRYAVEDYYEDAEQVMDDLVTLHDLLDVLAPKGYRFGAHEGDGSDYGFWPVEEED